MCHGFPFPSPVLLSPGITSSRKTEKSAREPGGRALCPLRRGQASFRMYTPDGRIHQGQAVRAPSGGVSTGTEYANGEIASGSVIHGSAGGRISPVRSFLLPPGYLGCPWRQQKNLTDKILLSGTSPRVDSSVGSLRRHLSGRRIWSDLLQTKAPNRKKWAVFPHMETLRYLALYHVIPRLTSYINYF